MLIYIILFAGIIFLKDIYITKKFIGWLKIKFYKIIKPCLYKDADEILNNESTPFMNGDEYELRGTKTTKNLNPTFYTL